MLKLLLAIYAVWQLIVVVFQFYEPLRTRWKLLSFYLCGLLPSWRMFGPNPIDGDYTVLYRLRSNAADQFADWQPLPEPAQVWIPANLFFDPRAPLVKAMDELGRQVCDSTSDRNVYYQLLLQYVIGQIRRNTQAAPPDQVQFRIDWRTPSSLHPLFHSHVHSL